MTTEGHSEVFEHALGLDWPWYVDRISFDDESRTLAFESMVVLMAEEMPIRAVSRIVGEHDTRLTRVVSHHREWQPRHG